MLVDVAAVDVLFVETQIRSGWGRQWFDVQPPFVPGNGITGTVSAVGAGVDASWVGRRVSAHTGQRGGYAECAVVAVDALVEVPEALDLVTAAALLHDGVTALGLLDAVPVREGDQVLATAAAGGLGLTLVQLTLAAGARVVGAVRGQQKLDLVTAQGAEAVDYSVDGWTQRVVELTGGSGPDVVFDGSGGDTGAAALGIVAKGGRFSAHGAAAGTFTAPDDSRGDVTITGIEAAQHEPAEVNRYTARAFAAAVDGRIRPVVGRRFPIAQAADAHTAIEGRTAVGKTLLVA